MPNAFSPDFPAHSAEPTIVRLRPRHLSSGFPKFLLLLACFGLFVLSVIAGAAVLGALGYYQVTDRILPGVKVGQLDLGGMTQDEAVSILDKNWSIDTRIQVSNGTQSQSLSPAQLGLALDTGLAARRAYDYAHSGSIPLRLAQTVASLKDGWQVEANVSVDPQVARTALESLAPVMSQPAKDASLRYEAGQLVAVPAELGYTINIEQTLSQFQASPQQVLETGMLHDRSQAGAPRGYRRHAGYAGCSASVGAVRLDQRI